MASKRYKPKPHSSWNRKKRRKKASAGSKAWLGIAALLLCMAAFIAFRAVFVQEIYDDSRADGDIVSDAPNEIADIPVTTDFLPIGAAGRTGKTRKIHYITIHETDNKRPSADAEAHNEYIHEHGMYNKLSWHYTVDENEIYHHIPDDETAFHAGDNIRREGGNRNGIGIELCVNRGSDFDQTMHNAAILTAYLLDKYNLTIDDVKKHQDFSGKHCPSTIISEGRWDEFKAMVEQALYDRRNQLVSDEE